ncbi:MAG TPA: squalene/phytoene synthase family protein [Anaerolineales bacterium]|nr:squalene/phytoene synthase family protein [Anaerolineales bacterium]
MPQTKIKSGKELALSITKAASQQTYYTIRFLVDRELIADAYRAYAYFRWVDDTLDADLSSGPDRRDFVQRQQSLLEKCYRAESARDVTVEEQMLVELIQRDTGKNSGLQAYLRNMMAVMAFDAERRGRIISQTELNEYTRWLASAVTEAMHYFIGHSCYSPRTEARYLAVTAAHITHMLRDTHADVQVGYFNIPHEALEATRLAPQDVGSDAYRAWVRGRVQLARSYFRAGRDYLNQVENPRCRLAGIAYMARFEGVLDLIERDGYLLRATYPERTGLGNIARASGSIFAAFIPRPGTRLVTPAPPVHQRSLRQFKISASICANLRNLRSSFLPREQLRK